MALKKTVTTPHGFQSVDAYHRVENVSIENKTKISFTLFSYKQSQGCPQFAQMTHSCDYDLTGANPIAQAYAHLKTLSEFASAEDC